jgi:hypothetical protein
VRLFEHPEFAQAILQTAEHFRERNLRFVDRIIGYVRDLRPNVSVLTLAYAVESGFVPALTTLTYRE